jgi:hypothetical protein
VPVLQHIGDRLLIGGLTQTAPAGWANDGSWSVVDVVEIDRCRYLLWQRRDDAPMSDHDAEYAEHLRRQFGTGDKPKHVPGPELDERTPPPLPKLTRADLVAGLHYLEDQKRQGLPAAAAVLQHIDALRADLARIPVGARSKHGTARWTGHHWKENDHA